MARLAVADGITGIVCTPHWMASHYENTRQKVMESVAQFAQLLEREGIPLKVYPGSELRIDSDLARKLESRELLTLNDTGCFALIELHPAMVPHNIEQLFFDLQLIDVTPILAHPERNGVIMRDPARLHAWVQMGVLIQVTNSSLLGRFGPEAQWFSTILLEHHMVHILATDSHGLKSRQPRLSSGVRAAEKILGANAVRQLVDETPRRIIEGKPVSVPNPIPIGKQSLKPSILKKFFSFLKATAAS